MEAKVGQRPFDGVFVAPFVDGGGEDARFFEGSEEKIENGGVREGVVAVGGEALGFANEGPDILDGGVGIPVGGEACTIGLEIFKRDGAVGGA